MVVQELTEIEEKNIEEYKVPVFVVKDKILMSPGIWKGYYYDEEAIRRAYEETDWTSKEIRSLFLDHQDEYSREWIGEVKNVRLDANNNIVGDLIIVDENTARKIAYGAKFGISPKVQAHTDDNNVIKKFVFQNFSVVITPAVKTAYINNWEINKNSEVKNMEEEEKTQEEVVEEKTPESTETPEKTETPEEPETSTEEETTEETTEEKMSDEDLAELERAAKLVLEFVKKKKKYPEPDEEEKKKKKEYPYPEMSDTKIEKIQQEFSEKLSELDKKISQLVEKPEKPEKKSVVIENVGLSNRQGENVDLLMTEWLKGRVIK